MVHDSEVSIAASQPSIQKACKLLLKKVLQCTSTIANNYHGESGHRSPYRPSSTYMFCLTESASCIEDPEAIWKMLHLTMQRAEKKSFVIGACMTEHLGYKKMFERVTQSLIKNAAKVGNFISESFFEMGTTMKLEAMGVGAQNNSAFIALREAGYFKKRHVLNIEKLNYELRKYQSYMAELEWYKVMCKSNGVGYCDAIKSLGDLGRKEFHANLTRISLEIFWNDIFEKIPTPEVLEVDLDQ